MIYGFSRERVEGMKDARLWQDQQMKVDVRYWRKGKQREGVEELGLSARRGKTNNVNIGMARKRAKGFRVRVVVVFGRDRAECVDLLG